MSTIEFWKGFSAELNLADFTSSAVSVKGTRYKRVHRFLEIYSNTSYLETIKLSPLGYIPHTELKQCYLPRIPGLLANFGKNIYQPPFVWNDSGAKALVASFTYNTNAIFRILYNLAGDGKIKHSHIDFLLDSACVMLTQIYKSGNNEIMRYMNNNINMFMISKVIETLLGKDNYNSDLQEPRLTSSSLETAINLVKEHTDLLPKQQMALALGKGIAFLEKNIRYRHQEINPTYEANLVAYRYVENHLAIDHRDTLISIIENSDNKSKTMTMCAILDDTAESVDDLLWIQSLMRQFPLLKVDLLVNTAQISINFSHKMLRKVLSSKTFSWLSSQLWQRLSVTAVYCPLISFQTNYLDQEALDSVSKADLVFVKGLNFFETCQFSEKDTFHSFVVYGPTSRLYTGLSDYDGVFAFLPAGKTGYIHDREETRITNLKMIVNTSLNREKK
ncbi:MAG: hypothetical protein ABW118_06465 [Candidatus Thiodiazotropha sp.]